MSKENYITLTEAAELLQTSKPTIIRRLNKLGAKQDKFTYKEGKVKYINKKLVELNFNLAKYKETAEVNQRNDSEIVRNNRNDNETMRNDLLQSIENLKEESNNKTKQLIAKDNQIKQQLDTIAELTERQKETNVLLLRASEKEVLLIEKNIELQKELLSLSAPEESKRNDSEIKRNERNDNETMRNDKTAEKEEAPNSRQSSSYAALLLLLLVSLAAAGAFVVAQLF